MNHKRSETVTVGWTSVSSHLPAPLDAPWPRTLYRSFLSQYASAAPDRVGTRPSGRPFGSRPGPLRGEDNGMRRESDRRFLALVPSLILLSVTPSHPAPLLNPTGGTYGG